MGTGLRRAGIACAVLLALAAAFLFSRLDSDALLAELMSQAGKAGMSLSVGKVSFSPMNGLSLRLDDLDVKGHGLRLHARTAFISSSWRALVSGGFTPDTLFLNTADITLDRLQEPSAMLPHLPPLSRLNISKSTLTLQESGLKLDDLQLDVRDVAPDRDMRWELLARAGNEPITSHGQAHLNGNSFETAFAKLKMEHVPLAALPVADALAKLPYHYASSAVTIDLAANGEWHAFGELRLMTTPADESPLIVRSKLQGGDKQWLAWHDSYIHFGGQNVVDSEGSCRTGNDCTGRFSGTRIAVQSLNRLLGSQALHGSSGNLDLKGQLNWKDETLVGSIAGTWHNLHFGKSSIALLDAKWQLPLLSYRPGEALQLAQLGITPLRGGGEAELSRFVRDSQGTRYTLKLLDNSVLWQPLANIALAYEGLPTQLAGSGEVNGIIRGNHTPKRAQLRFELDASRAAVSYGDHFSKPARVSMILHGDWQYLHAGARNRLALQESDIGGSRFAAMHWQHDKQGDRIALEKAAIDFTALNSTGIRLPAAIPALGGSIHGDLSGHWQRKEGTEAAIWHSLQGKLQLRAFTWQQNRVDGDLDIRDGVAASDKLAWSHGSNSATMHGRIDLATRTGELDLDQAILDSDILTRVTTLPFTLKGSLRKLHYHMADQTAITAIHGRYTRTPEALTLLGAEGELAGGTVTADELSLRPGQSDPRLSARLRIGRVQLSRITQWPAWLQARPFGRCFGNMQIEGPLSSKRWPEWRGNGDIAIFSGGWIPLVQQGQQGEITAQPGEPKRFRRAELRFRLQQNGMQLPHLRIERDGQILQGDGRMDYQGHIALTLGRGKERQKIDGEWPNIDLPMEPAAATP